MRICFISEPLHAGVGRHIVDLSLELVRRGHEVHVVYSPRRADPEFVRAIQGVAGLRCHAVRMPREIGLGDLAAFWRVARYIRAQGPFDLIHGHSSKAGGYARLLGLVHKAPILYTAHAFVTCSPALALPKALVFRALERVLAPLTDRIVCTSAFERHHALRDLGIATRRVAVVHNGLPPLDLPTREASRAALQVAPDRIVAGFVGRMDRQKAPERLIAAVRPLLAELPQLTVAMIGDGARRRALENELYAEGLSDRVLWFGEVDARRYMPGFDFLVCSSLYEGFAYVLLEALQCGLPIVTTSVGGADEAVEYGLNGIVVPQDSPEILAGAIRLLATQDTVRHAMSQASRARAARFTLTGMADGIEAVYAELAQGFAVKRASAATGGERAPAGRMG